MKNLFILLGAILITNATFAQSASSSPYSVYGLGTINERTSSLNRSLGGTGIGIESDSYLNLANPAAYVSIDPPVSHIFEVGIFGESNHYMTSDLTTSQFNGGLSNMNYWFKLKPWWAAVAGISPFSTVSYQIAMKKTLSTGNTANYVYNGSGNITSLSFGNSFRLAKNLSVGVNLNYIFGTITHKETISASAYNDALSLYNKIFTNKFTADFGVQQKFPIGKDRSVVLGATFGNAMNLNGNSDLALLNSLSDTLTEYSGKDLHYKLPASYGFGASFNSGSSTIAADLKFQPWSTATLAANVPLSDTWKVSLGYLFNGKTQADSYRDLLTFRTGVYMQNNFLQYNGNRLYNYGFSMGVGMPVLDGKSTINVGYQFDKFGTTRDGLIKQWSHKFTLDVVIRDMWGIKRRFD